MVMIDRDKKLRLLLIILSVTILFPDTSFAHTTGLVDSFTIASPFIILFANLFKFLIIAEFKGRTDYKSLLYSIFFVLTLEIFLVFFVFIVLSIFLSIFYTDPIYEMKEMHLFFLLIFSFGIITIAPNVLLVKEKKEKFFETIAVPKKLIFAAMLAFITPSIEAVLLIFSLVRPP